MNNQSQKSPKRGGWKGPKKSRRNYESHELWMALKKAGRPNQAWINGVWWKFDGD